MELQQEVHCVLRYHAYRHISSDIWTIPHDFIEFETIFSFEDEYYTLGCTPQLVVKHQAQQDIQFGITVGYCMQKNTQLVIFYHYECKALHLQDLAYWKN